MSDQKTARRAKDEGSIIRCDACPVLCRIREGKIGACDRYANVGGTLTRVDPLLVTERAETLVPFLDGAEDWDAYVETVNRIAGDEIEAALAVYQGYYDEFLKGM